MIALYKNWPLAIANRVGLTRKKTVHKYYVRVAGAEPLHLFVRGGGFDIRAVNEVYIGRVYDRWYRGPKPADVVIDIGAHCGYFSLLADKLWRPAHLISVEPDPANQSLLRQNAAINGAELNFLPVAITARESSAPAKLHRSTDSRLHTLLEADERLRAGLDERAADLDEIQVKTMTLGALVEKNVPSSSRISFIKLDIEGLEWPVLSHMTETLWQRVDCAVVESDSKIPQDLAARLGILGFTVDTDGPFWAIRRA
jgi:FkbM family methyltransferase